MTAAFLLLRRRRGGVLTADSFAVGGVVPFLWHSSERDAYGTRESRLEDYAINGVVPYFVHRSADDTYLEG